MVKDAKFLHSKTLPDCADALADLSLRWRTCQRVRFLMLRLIWKTVLKGRDVINGRTLLTLIKTAKKKKKKTKKKQTNKKQ